MRQLNVRPSAECETDSWSSGGPFTPTPGEKIQKRALSPCPNFPGRKIVYVVYCINCVLKLKDGGGLDR